MSAPSSTKTLLASAWHSLPAEQPGAVSGWKSTRTLISHLHQLGKSQILPSWLSLVLGSSLNAECCVLVWNDVILVFWVERLILLWDKDIIWCDFLLAEVVEEVGVALLVEVHVCVLHVFRLGRVSVR